MPFVGSSPLQGVAEALIAGKQLKLQRERQKTEGDLAQGYLGIAKGREERLAAEEARQAAQLAADRQAQGQIIKTLYGGQQAQPQEHPAFQPGGGLDFGGAQAQAQQDPEDDAADQRLASLAPNVSPEGFKLMLGTLEQHKQEKQLRKGALNFATTIRRHAKLGSYGQAGAKAAEDWAGQLEQSAQSADPQSLAEMMKFVRERLGAVQEDEWKTTHEQVKNQALSEGIMQSIGQLPGGMLNPKAYQLLTVATRAGKGLYGKPEDALNDAKVITGELVPVYNGTDVDLVPPELAARYTATLKENTDLKRLQAEAELAKTKLETANLGVAGNKDKQELRNRARIAAQEEAQKTVDTRAYPFVTNVTPVGEGDVDRWVTYFETGKLPPKAAAASAQNGSAPKVRTPEQEKAIESAAAAARAGKSRDEVRKILTDAGLNPDAEQ